jgi:hypothetical protein
MKSFKAEVIADYSNTWCSNQLRFATAVEAEAYASDLAYRWTSVQKYRTAESDDPVTHVWRDGKAQTMGGESTVATE